jgi:hypothetical protein
MKPTAVDVDLLEDLALELGATLEYDDGNVFNVAGRRGQRMPRGEGLDPMKELADKVALLADRPIHVKVDAPAPQVVVQPAEAKKTVAWTFEFERNADGTIKRIHATPKE